MRFTFPVVKLLDYDDAALAADPNPLAVVVRAHRLNLTEADPDRRRADKFTLVRELFERGYHATQVRQLFRLVDWLVKLPPPQAVQFRRELDVYEKANTVPYVTQTEQLRLDDARAEAKAIGLQEGRVEGREEGLMRGLEEGQRAGLRRAVEVGLRFKYGPAGLALMPRVNAITDLPTLDAVLVALETDAELAAVAALLPPG